MNEFWWQCEKNEYVFSTAEYFPCVLLLLFSYFVYVYYYLVYTHS